MPHRVLLNLQALLGAASALGRFWVEEELVTSVRSWQCQLQHWIDALNLGPNEFVPLWLRECRDQVPPSPPQGRIRRAGEEGPCFSQELLGDLAAIPPF